MKRIPDSSAKQGDAIKHGSIIRLQHMKTRRWLHSHLHASPISGNLEVGLTMIPLVKDYDDCGSSQSMVIR